MIKISYQNKNFILMENKVSLKILLEKINLYNEEIIALSINNKIMNLNDIIIDDNIIIDKIITKNLDEALKILQKTTSHILAAAVNNLFENVKFVFGSSLNNGFFYDFDFENKITINDLKLIENEMKNIIKNNEINFYKINKNEGLKIFKNNTKHVNKINILEKNNSNENLFVCKSKNNFIDLCIQETYLENYNIIKNFKLLSITGAYLNNNSNNKMVSRIYGVVFFTEEDLIQHINILSKNKSNDHNTLGKKLNLFATNPNIGKGLPIFLPKGAKILQILQRFIEDLEYKNGYQLTKTPFLAKKQLYEISGHWQYYKDNMILIDMNNEEYALRPMTCPFQFQVLLNKKLSYQDFPIRLNETSTLFRKELSGEMHGLIRLKQFTISEGHIICTENQLNDEFLKCLELTQYLLKKLKLDKMIYFRLSFYDINNFQKYIGEIEQWDNIQNQMIEILKSKNINYTQQYGEAAFYGPKLDIQIKNIYGKEDTLITIQIDFELAKKFNIYYKNNNNEKEYPYIIHRTSIGCYERTLALLIEYYKGIFPLWLAPEQIRILVLDNEYTNYAENINNYLMKLNFRTSLDNRNKKINSKIKDCYLEKLPYFLIIGKNEEQNKNISYRKYGDNQTYKVSIQDLVKLLNNELKEE